MEKTNEELFERENDKESDNYEAWLEEESLKLLEDENRFEPFNEKDSLNETRLENISDLHQNQDTKDVNYNKINAQNEDLGDKGDIQEDKEIKKDEELKDKEKIEEKEKKNDKKKKEKIDKAKRGKRGKKGKRGKSMNTKGIEKELRKLRKSITNKSLLMKSDEELAREMMNKKYKRFKNLEDLRNRN